MINLHGVNLSDEQVKLVSGKMVEASLETVYSYPWNRFEEELERKSLPFFTIVGYGSLMNSDSAAQTLQEASSRLGEPVIAFGVRRIFNYEMSGGFKRYGPPPNAAGRAALNVRLTSRIEDAVNGILTEVSVSDLPSLRARERGYDLVPVACLPWKDVEKPPFCAYILCFREERRNGESPTREALQPHPEYYRVCRRGAGAFGKQFLQFWLASTYLSDGVTPIAEWEKRCIS